MRRPVAILVLVVALLSLIGIAAMGRGVLFGSTSKSVSPDVMDLTLGDIPAGSTIRTNQLPQNKAATKAAGKVEAEFKWERRVLTSYRNPRQRPGSLEEDTRKPSEDRRVNWGTAFVAAGAYEAASSSSRNRRRPRYARGTCLSRGCAHVGYLHERVVGASALSMRIRQPSLERCRATACPNVALGHTCRNGACLLITDPRGPDPGPYEWPDRLAL